jgi:cytochrome c peroxidase
MLLLLVAAAGTTVAQNASLTPTEQLGKSIFFDENLSINYNQSCAACHAPEVGWTGPDEAVNIEGAVYEGSILGRFGNRNPPSSAYATQSPILYMDNQEQFVGGNFWDGRATGEKLGNPAADQAQGPFLNPMEQALPDSACVVYRVCNAADYPVFMQEVWGSDICAINWPDDIETVCTEEGATVALDDANRVKSNLAYDKIALSIAAYEASPEVNAFTSKFDYSGKCKVKLTKQERKGFALFQGKGKCAKCHISTGKKPLFTDFTYDNLGIPKNPLNPVYSYDPEFVDYGLGGFLATTTDYAAYALQNNGKHKVPSLRNVDKRPYESFVKAYGHNGYFKSLKEIVHFYNTRDVEDWPDPEVPDNVNTAELGNLGLSEEEEDAIVAFLTTLTDGYVPGSK